MRSVNRVILIGNLTRDPELKQTANGQNVVTFGLATNRQWITNGEKKTLTEYHHISGWGKIAEISHQYLKKGKCVYIEGYLKTLSWDSEEGVRQQRTEVVMQDMIILTPRQKKEGGEGDEMMEEDFFNPETEVEAA